MSIVDTIAKLAPLIFGGILLLIALLAYFRRGRLKLGNFVVDLSPNRLDIEIERIRRRTQKAAEILPTDKQFVLLREYHAQGLAQSKISFWFSLVFASLGFSVIISAIITMDRSISLAQQDTTWLTLIAGTVIDAVAALFFVQSNKARQLMVDFFDRLRNDRKLEEALSLASQLRDPILSSRLGVVLSLYLADTRPSDALLTSIVEGKHGNVPPDKASPTAGKDDLSINAASEIIQAPNPTVERTETANSAVPARSPS
ncbi:MAG TPA: hypothetical protein VF789_20630 [Thermoanaerobaculia bacterium]